MNTVQPPPTHYTVNNPADPIAIRLTRIRRDGHLLFDEAMPEADTDFELTVASLAIATGYSRRRVGNIILAFFQLHDLPLLNALQRELFHLDIQRLIVIANALFGLDPEHLGVMDELLTDYLTPAAPNQVLPLQGSISRKIKAIRDMLGDPKATGDTGPGRKEFSTSDNTDGTTELFATVDPVEGRLINDAVARHANATGKTQGEAFADLILNNLNVKVTINLYTTSDLADVPVWASGAGWLDEATDRHWMTRATRTRDMDAAMGRHVAGHDPLRISRPRSRDATAAVRHRTAPHRPRTAIWIIGSTTPTVAVPVPPTCVYCADATTTARPVGGPSIYRIR